MKVGLKVFLLLVIALQQLSCKSSRAAIVSNLEDHYQAKNKDIYKNTGPSSDLEYEKEINESGFPIYVGSFPVAEYNTPGNGTMGFPLKIGERDVVSRSVFIRRGEQNESLLKPLNKNSEVLINLLCLTDDVSLPNPSIVTSRNHPNYLAEGTFNSRNYKTDWVVIRAYDGKSYAIINMKFFNLKYGRTILVAPQQSGEIHFKQLQDELLEETEVELYLDQLTRNIEVIDFFVKEGNIR
ncbi:hypothetical protein [Zeaxanthinibacter enoshimensis]|uniref:Uncharacterized protein n=1 Tax=Zeaxanthinibacter enoshimensis TaxID=392009 RepID=A0A4V3D485_9FLAO|nr:hypothetical protein [Zeaxanthinibacter enoshimensis]TDQ33361.1 hypothetical protein CLV82_1200 [Zeaxanthinibacter enoshimensis]